MDEQHVPLDMEIDHHDSTDAHHYLGWQNSEPVAAARIVIFPSYAKLQRIALINEHRGKGLGGVMLRQLIEFARTLAPDLPIALDAQIQARGLYEKQGFEAQGDVFDDAGIDHIHMRLR
ncbi:GNAT family N-acetyltransferase [Ahrensia sp. R2A130]|uniref:GNAT family N-acetyltransferase n=1 Tax=Ahrensia sp. R2A130 TaxID=744979 RepID=UPI0003075F49|nr:GNAT family N-acetyltransferase [Ahrensia sp. R2A130]